MCFSGHQWGCHYGDSTLTNLNEKNTTLVSYKTSLRKAYRVEKNSAKESWCSYFSNRTQLAISEFPSVALLKQVEVRNLCYGCQV